MINFMKETAASVKGDFSKAAQSALECPGLAVLAGFTMLLGVAAVALASPALAVLAGVSLLVTIGVAAYCAVNGRFSRIPEDGGYAPLRQAAPQAE